MQNIKCHKCQIGMIKGQHVPAVGTIGLYWTGKLEFSKWKFDTLPKARTYQYLCTSCGLVETYVDLDEYEKIKDKA